MLLHKACFSSWADKKSRGWGSRPAGVSEGGSSSLYQFVNKDKILHLIECNREADVVHRDVNNRPLFFFKVSIQVLVCQLTKRKLGPPLEMLKQLR